MFDLFEDYKVLSPSYDGQHDDNYHIKNPIQAFVVGDDIRTSGSSSTINSLFESSLGELQRITTDLTPSISKSDDCEKEMQISDGFIDTKIFVMLVGLPASGKSTVANKLVQTLNKEHQNARIYNAGDVRRKLKRSASSSDFFDPSNNHAREEREAFAFIAISNLIRDLKNNNLNIGIFDATNTTKQRRDSIVNILKHENVSCVILDVQCSNESMLHHNIARKTQNPDYEGRDYSKSLFDFNRRLAHYRKVYEAISDAELEADRDVVICYMKIKDLGTTTEVKNISTKDEKKLMILEHLSSFLQAYHANEEVKYWDGED